jgi:hypothetical protein
MRMGRPTQDKRPLKKRQPDTLRAFLRKTNTPILLIKYTQPDSFHELSLRRIPHSLIDLTQNKNYGKFLSYSHLTKSLAPMVGLLNSSPNFLNWYRMICWEWWRTRGNEAR